MPRIIYVNQYEPSSASITLGGDPIYRTSTDIENVRVGVPPSWLWLAVIAGGLGLAYLFMKD